MSFFFSRMRCKCAASTLLVPVDNLRRPSVQASAVTGVKARHAPHRVKRTAPCSRVLAAGLFCQLCVSLSRQVPNPRYGRPDGPPATKTTSVKLHGLWGPVTDSPLRPQVTTSSCHTAAAPHAVPICMRYTFRAFVGYLRAVGELECRCSHRRAFLLLAWRRCASWRANRAQRSG